jgi:hypothetical protein
MDVLNRRLSIPYDIDLFLYGCECIYKKRNEKSYVVSSSCNMPWRYTVCLYG